MSLEIKGVVTEIGEVQAFNEGKFEKKQILLTVKDGSYEQVLPIDVSNKNLNIFDAVDVGDNVIVDINLRSNEWQGKHYPSINGWRVAVVKPEPTDEVKAVPATTTDDPAPDTASGDAPTDDGADDLPF